MRITLLALVAVLAGCSTNPEYRIIRSASAAMTGSPWTLTAAASLTVEGTGSAQATGDASPTSIDWFQQALNLRKGASIERLAHPNQPLASRTLPESELMHHPMAFVMAALTRAKPSNTRRVGDLDAVDLNVGGVTYSLFVDGSSGQPVRITSRRDGHDHETSFERYVAVHGYRLPSLVTAKVDGKVVRTLEVKHQHVLPDPVTWAEANKVAKAE